MSGIKIIDKLEKIENVMCIYRNYLLYKKYCKLFIKIRLVIESCMFFTYLFIICYIFELQRPETDLSCIIFMFQFLNLSNNLIFVISGILKNKNYKNLLKNLKEIYEFYEHDLKYIGGLKFLNLLVWTSILMYIVLRGYFIIRELVDASFWDIRIAVMIIVVLGMWNEIRIILEALVCYTFITIVYNLLQCFNNSIYQRQNNLNRARSNLVLKNIEVITVPQVQEWAEKYQLLVNCNQELSSCFQSQMIFSLTMFPLIYICLAYGAMSAVLTEQPAVISIHMSMILLYLMCSKSLVVYAGQKLRNESAITIQSLSKLHNLLLKNPHAPTTRAVKKLKLLTILNPLELRVMKLPLGMFMIPMILSTTISQVIIALQFRNVI